MNRVFQTVKNLISLICYNIVNLTMSVFFVLYLIFLSNTYYYYKYELNYDIYDFYDYYKYYIYNNFWDVQIYIIACAVVYKLFCVKELNKLSNNMSKLLNILIFIGCFNILIFLVFENTIVSYFKRSAWSVFAITAKPDVGIFYIINSIITYVKIDNFIFLGYMFVGMFIFYHAFKQKNILKHNYIYTFLIVVTFAFFQNFFLKDIKIIKASSTTDTIKRLSEPNGYASIKASGNSIIAPKTIVFIIIESGGQFKVRNDNGSTIKMAEYLSEMNKDPENWIVFENAVTNSSASQVSIPSFLTGTGIEENITKLHSMPRLNDMAKAKGYKRSFLTSWFLQWENLDKFMLGNNGFEINKSAKDFEVLPVNDLGIDDGIVISDAQKHIESAPEGEKIFLTLGLNALHDPLQTKSNIPIPAQLKSRLDRAMYITIAAHDRIIQSLKKTNRYDDSLIIIVGDHGETFGAGVKNPFLARIFDLDEQILKVTFLMKLPVNTPEKTKSALRSNQNAHVANLDIAPTFAALMGIELNNNLFWKGQNLLNPVPEDRLSLAANVTEWRPATGTALALVRKHERLVCNSSSGCEYINTLFDSAMTAQDRQSKLNAYLKEASEIPVIRENLMGIQEQMRVKNNTSAFIQNDADNLERIR